MWSNLYWYYELRGNEARSHYLPARTIFEAFEDTGVLEKKQSQVYSNKEGTPWIHVIAINSASGPRQYDNETINIIHVIGSKQEPDNERFYIDLLSGIAEKINWEFILEEDDDGNEDVVLRAIAS